LCSRTQPKRRRAFPARTPAWCIRATPTRQSPLCRNASPPWRERKRAYLEHLEEASASALKVSLSDKLHNARTIVVDYRDVGEELWERFNADRDQVLAYYRALAATFSRLTPGALATELAVTVGELDALVAVVSPTSIRPKNQGM